MDELVVLVLFLLLAVAGFAAGRWYGQAGYRLGYRSGYRQGYFDGDRASWTRRRRDLQAAVAAVLAVSPEQRTEQFTGSTAVGTTYTSAVRQRTDAGQDAAEDREMALGQGATP